MILIQNVSKNFGSTKALVNVSLECAAGKTTVLLGTSGSGKSTLLRLINGLIAADRGELFFSGQPINGKNIRSLRRKMGYVIQEGGLFPHLTAADNISLIARYIGWNNQDIQKRIGRLSEITRLSPLLLKRYPRELSGGQRQRVSLMRGLMLDPEVLLLDEPLGALDPITRSELQEDLKTIFNNLQRTVVFVTHHLGEAAFLGDIIALMKDGEILQKGTMKDLQKAPKDPFVTQFIKAERSHRDEIQ